MSETQTRSHKAEKVIERLGQKLNRQIAGSMVACVHCGLCTDSCHYVIANPDDPTYAPAYKADRIRKLFKRHYDWTGRVFPWWVKAGSVFTDEELEEMKDIAFGKCTNSRRCTIKVSSCGARPGAGRINGVAPQLRQCPATTTSRFPQVGQSRAGVADPRVPLIARMIVAKMTQMP